MFSPDAVFASCPTGAVIGAWRTTLERGLGLGGEIRPGQALAVWTADLLRRELPSYTDGVTLWVSGAGVPEGRWAEVVYTVDGKPPPLTITDGRLVWVHGTDAPFDVATGKTAAHAGSDWFHVSVFNLRALYQLCSDKVAKWTAPQQKFGPTPIPQPSAS